MLMQIPLSQIPLLPKSLLPKSLSAVFGKFQEHTQLKKTLYLGFLLGITVYNILEAKNELVHDQSAHRKVKVSGDVLQVIIPIVALALPIIKNNALAQRQFIQSAVITFAITHALKHGVNATRPNGGNRSFPSGHTSSAFQGAAFLHKQYGFLHALPAYAGAAYVGFSRVNTKKHFTTDVVAGAIIGFLVSFMVGGAT